LADGIRLRVLAVLDIFSCGGLAIEVRA